MRNKWAWPIGILITLIGFVIVAKNVYESYQDFLNPPCVDAPLDAPQTPREFTTNNQDLIFLTKADKQKIYDAIDSAISAKDFDDKFFFALNDVFDSYNANNKNPEDLLLPPEIMSDNPEKIEITGGGCKADLLAGIDISPIKKEDLPNLKAFAKLFIEETSRYPLSWWKQAVPPVLVFVKTIRENGDIVGGVQHGIVIYNISEIEDVDYSKILIHHELMHWVELATRTRTDSAWPGIPTDYKQKYDFTSEDNYSFHPQPGFITGYSRTNSLEDKAEVYSYIFHKDGAKLLNGWAKTDPILAKKVKYIKDFIKARVGKMDDKYFNNF